LAADDALVIGHSGLFRRSADGLPVP